jgi:iron(II)-dependent oxidoreductase
VLPDYWIDVYLVTNARFALFLADDGYKKPEWWADEGWRWLQRAGVEAPAQWGQAGWDGPDQPVAGVSWYEADAYARWAGRRLPTEQEWEKAAAWDPSAGRARGRPWGDAEPTPQRATLDQLAFGPAPAGALPAGASAYGVLGMMGDGWEWTSSRFEAYPGFIAFPYPQYSEVFFRGDFRVLRGGSWATRPSMARNSFRNWDHPQRRQLFTSFRCAQDQ